MSLVAILPIASVVAANAALQAAGFGPDNCSVPAYSKVNPAPSHAALHSWSDAVFESAVTAIAGVITDIDNGDPITRTQALITAQAAQWGAQAPALPSTGNVTKGNLYTHGGAMWWVIQTFNRTTYGAVPSTYPALIREVRNPGVAVAWKQPIDQYDSYQLVNMLTGKPDKCLWTDGKVYASKIANNTYSPTGYPAGWQVLLAP